MCGETMFCLLPLFPFVLCQCASIHIQWCISNSCPPKCLQCCFVVTWLSSAAMWNCCRLGASSVYTIELCTSLQCQFIPRSHIRRMHVCLAVICHLHFWQNDRDLSRATAVTRGSTEHGYRNKSEQKVDHREKERKEKKKKKKKEKKNVSPLLPGL